MLIDAPSPARRVLFYLLAGKNASMLSAASVSMRSRLCTIPKRSFDGC